MENIINFILLTSWWHFGLRRKKIDSNDGQMIPSFLHFIFSPPSFFLSLMSLTLYFSNLTEKRGREERERKKMRERKKWPCQVKCVSSVYTIRKKVFLIFFSHLTNQTFSFFSPFLFELIIFASNTLFSWGRKERKEIGERREKDREEEEDGRFKISHPPINHNHENGKDCLKGTINVI